MVLIMFINVVALCCSPATMLSLSVTSPARLGEAVRCLTFVLVGCTYGLSTYLACLQVVDFHKTCSMAVDRNRDRASFLVPSCRSQATLPSSTRGSMSSSSGHAEAPCVSMLCRSCRTSSSRGTSRRHRAHPGHLARHRCRRRGPRPQPRHPAPRPQPGHPAHRPQPGHPPRPQPGHPAPRPQPGHPARCR